MSPTKWKKKESDFVLLHDEVILYPYYKKKLVQAVNDIIMATPERDDNGGGKPNVVGRPTERAVMDILGNERLIMMRKVVDAVEQALNELEESKRRLFESYYWGGGKDRNIQIFCSSFGMSVSSFDRYQKAFLYRVGKITGLKR
jgi:RinA family phage transcriptional activator